MSAPRHGFFCGPKKYFIAAPRRMKPPQSRPKSSAACYDFAGQPIEAYGRDPMKSMLSTVAVALVLGLSTGAQAQSEITLLSPNPIKETIDTLVAKFHDKTG